MNKNTIPTPAQITEMYEIMNIVSDKYNNKSTQDYFYSVTFDINNDTTNIGEMFISLCVSKHFKVSESDEKVSESDEKVSESDEKKCEIIDYVHGCTFYVSVDEIISKMRESITRADKVA